MLEVYITQMIKLLLNIISQSDFIDSVCFFLCRKIRKRHQIKITWYFIFMVFLCLLVIRKNIFRVFVCDAISALYDIASSQFFSTSPKECLLKTLIKTLHKAFKLIDLDASIDLLRVVIIFDSHVFFFVANLITMSILRWSVFLTFVLYVGCECYFK